MTKPTFEEALGDLLSAYDDEDRDEIISALELTLLAQRKEAGK